MDGLPVGRQDAVGKSAPMDRGYLPHAINAPAVGPRIQALKKQLR